MSSVDIRVIEFLQKNKGECFHAKKLADSIEMKFLPGDMSGVVGFSSVLLRLAREGKIVDVVEDTGEHCWKIEG